MQKNKFTPNETLLYNTIMINKSEPIAEIVNNLYLAGFNPSSIIKIIKDISPLVTPRQLKTLSKVSSALDSSVIPNHFPKYKPKPMILGVDEDYEPTTYFYHENFSDDDIDEIDDSDHLEQIDNDY